MKGSLLTLLCNKLKLFLCFNPSLAIKRFVHGRTAAKSKICGKSKCCSWLISCEIIMSGLLKLEKFVPIYMLVKNEKMFQRTVLVFP